MQTTRMGAAMLLVATLAACGTGGAVPPTTRLSVLMASEAPTATPMPDEAPASPEATRVPDGTVPEALPSGSADVKPEDPTDSGSSVEGDEGSGSGSSDSTDTGAAAGTEPPKPDTEEPPVVVAWPEEGSGYPAEWFAYTSVAEGETATAPRALEAAMLPPKPGQPRCKSPWPGLVASGNLFLVGAQPASAPSYTLGLSAVPLCKGKDAAFGRLELGYLSVPGGFYGTVGTLVRRGGCLVVAGSGFFETRGQVGPTVPWRVEACVKAVGSGQFQGTIRRVAIANEVLNADPRRLVCIKGPLDACASPDMVAQAR
ncbi:MAG: hypothetical protein VKP62_04500 [Candidatus Sericytochromatia bacterium]|nr:hypothetical protein [Candidatus Sericytochromatia bacterium]